MTGVLPDDAVDALLVGRVWDPATGGPRPVGVRDDAVVDLFDAAPTVSRLLETPAADVAAAVAAGPARWDLDEILEASERRRGDAPHLLAPVDLQAVKACGVTFAGSMVERVIEERCGGDPARAAQVRAEVDDALGGVDIGRIVPGSDDAARVKEVLQQRGLWSQYLEVGIGPDPEVFTKAPVLASVGYGMRVGVPEFSTWNNPEPELVLVVDSRGRARGATLGNDVNLRDVEGRSALLLGMAKDNNASSALGPFVRLFDDRFTAADAAAMRISLRVEGTDGFVLDDVNDVARLSRTFERLIAAAHGEHHQYPDGFVLYTGTLFTPTQDRGDPGLGFTHRSGDVVTISSPQLGTLANEVAPTGTLSPWEFGIGALVDYLDRCRSAARA
ncbi:fumarylacetoacetate hydrolase family protein [Pseudonocardia nematodicida]|uniref:Fumarylacetoacetate hydrolase family protein n=1 Tax=Pseudonocardia nematodicida TaxID=1206997 RepID=A0ABV1KB03_9PSEU